MIARSRVIRATPQVNRQSPQAQGLVAALPLNDGGGLIARNALGRSHGPLTNGPTWKPGGGLYFTKASSQYVSVSGFSIDTTNSFTVSAYINPTGAYTYAAILGPDNNNGGFQFQILGTGALSMVKNNVIAIGTTSAGVVAPNTWTRVACSYYPSSGAFSIYVSGRTVLSGTNAQTLTSAPLFIGRQGVGLEYFDGAIADVRIYNPALSAAGVQQIHLRPHDLYAPPRSLPYVATIEEALNLWYGGQRVQQVWVGGQRAQQIWMGGQRLM